MLYMFHFATEVLESAVMEQKNVWIGPELDGYRGDGLLLVKRVA